MNRWLELVQQFDGDNLLPVTGKLLSDNGISLVVRGEDGIYKRSIPFLVENELWCLEAMAGSGFVPRVERCDKYTLLLEDLGKSETITSPAIFWDGLVDLSNALYDAQIRHGDITTQALIVVDDHPYLIDFAESRMWDDPRPDKRPEGDEYWLNRTYQELCNG